MALKFGRRFLFDNLFDELRNNVGVAPNWSFYSNTCKFGSHFISNALRGTY